MFLRGCDNEIIRYVNKWKRVEDVLGQKSAAVYSKKGRLSQTRIQGGNLHGKMSRSTWKI